MPHQRRLTPGAEYYVWLDTASNLEIFVDFPDNIAMTFNEDEAEELKKECLDAVETILARRWRRSRGKRKNVKSDKNTKSGRPPREGRG